MALHWDWKAKAGTVSVVVHMGKEYTANWYEGNGLMIVLNEWEEKGETYWSMGWFFADVDHAKTVLGCPRVTLTCGLIMKRQLVN